MVPDIKQNLLLTTVSEAALERWRAHLEWIELPLGKVIYESGGTLSHVYFPTTAIVSLLYVTEDGSSSEIAVVGNEGIVGVSLFLGGGAKRRRRVPLESASHERRI
jgi:CRP-like cAMP-binding protein